MAAENDDEYNDTVKTLRENPHLLFGKIDTFMQFVLLGKKPTQEFCNDQRFVEQTNKLLKQFNEIKNSIGKRSFKIKHLNEIAEKYIPLIKFVYGFDDIFREYDKTNFYEENPIIYEEINVLKSWIEEIPFLVKLKEIYYKKMELFNAIKEYNDFCFDIRNKFVVQLELVKRMNMNPETIQLVNELVTMITEMEEQRTISVSKLRTIIQIECQNCLKSKPSDAIDNRHYLVEHGDIRNERYPYNCIDCCDKHKRSRAIYINTGNKKCIAEIEKSFCRINDVIIKYQEFVQKFFAQTDIFRTTSIVKD